MQQKPVPAWVSVASPHPNTRPFWSTTEWKQSTQHTQQDAYHHLKRTVIRKEFPTLRTYQVELVDKALNAKGNVILVAPTGSGKTFVAVSLIRDALEKFPSKKIIFLCPTIPLVNQQAEVVESYIDVQFKVGAYSGTLGWVEDFYKDINVLVMTPQIFYDACKESTIYQDMLENIHLIIFDECHRTTKDYSYNKIMKEIYIPYYNFVKQVADPQLPIVVGLTASPAAKQTTAYTMLEVLKLCNNLKATIRIVEDFKEDLKDAVNFPEFLIRKVTMDTTSCIVSKTILDFYNRLKDMFDEEDTDLSKIAVVKYLLSKCNESLITLDNRSCRAAWDFFFDFKDKDPEFQEKVVDFLSDSQQFFKSKFNTDDLPVITSKHQELLKILEEEYDKKANLKTIIFVRSVEDGAHMLQYLNQNLPDSIVTQLYGHSEMTVKQQLTQVKEFSEKGSIMIATSVAEEGLDIESCNITVRMHSIHTALEMIQSRGRARYKEGKFYCFYHDNSYELFKAEALKWQEQKMERAIKALCYLESCGVNICELTDFSNCFDLVLKYFKDVHKSQEVEHSTSRIQFDELNANQLLINTFSKLFNVDNVDYAELVNNSRGVLPFFQFAVKLPNGSTLPPGNILSKKKEAKANAAIQAIQFLLKYDLICPFSQLGKKFFETDNLISSTSTKSFDGNSLSSNNLEELSRASSSSSLVSVSSASKSKGVDVPASSILSESNAKNILMYFIQTNFYPQPEYTEKAKTPHFVVIGRLRAKDNSIAFEAISDPLKKKIDAEKNAAMKLVLQIIGRYGDFTVSSKLRLV